MRGSYEEVPCVNVKRWKMLNNLIRQRSHLAPGHGARVRYSLGTNVSTPFFQVPTLELGHGHGARVSTRLRPCTRVCLFSLLSSGFKMASDRAKRINYVQGHVPGTQSVNTTPFCAGVTVICVSPWLVPEQQSVNRPSLNSVGTGVSGRTSAEVHMFRIFVYQS